MNKGINYISTQIRLIQTRLSKFDFSFNKISD